SLATTRTLEALRDSGVRAVLAVGEVAPNSSSRKIDSLLVVKVSPEAAGRIVGRSELSFYDAGATPVALPRGIVLRTNTEFLPRASAINTMGFVAGKDPVRASELVIVCADLDSDGAFRGVRRTKPEDLGIGTAALLELARNYAYFSRLISIPERTILLAVWSGSRTDHAGLRAYLRHPLWVIDQTVAVVYIGLSDEKAEEVREILERRAIRRPPLAPPRDTGTARTPAAPPAPGQRTVRAPGPVPEQRHVLQRASPGTRRPAEGARRVWLQ